MATRVKTKDGRPLANTEDDASPSQAKVRGSYSAASNRRFDDIEKRVVGQVREKR